MKRRYKRNEAGELVDRNGTVLSLQELLAGQVEAITVNLASRARAPSRARPGASAVKAIASQSKELLPPTPYGFGDDVLTVWRTYVDVMGPRRKDIDEGARGIIREALKVATAVECQRAIAGCFASGYHMGQNERRKRYNNLSQILKGKRGGRTTREQIDMFLEIAEKAGVQSANTSVDPARIATAKRQVRDAQEFPGDADVVQRGKESVEWLALHGVVFNEATNDFEWRD